MMIVVANLRLSGFFALVSEWVVEHAHHPLTLLAAIILVPGTFSFPILHAHGLFSP
jgi:Na+/H+ antiporter NhaD/arsenite permease-like protein